MKNDKYKKLVFFLQKLEANSEAIRRNLNEIDVDPLPKFRSLDWRYDIQVINKQLKYIIFYLYERSHLDPTMKK